MLRPPLLPASSSPPLHSCPQNINTCSLTPLSILFLLPFPSLAPATPHPHLMYLTPPPARYPFHLDSSFRPSFPSGALCLQRPSPSSLSRRPCSRPPAGPSPSRRQRQRCRAPPSRPVPRLQARLHTASPHPTHPADAGCRPLRGSDACLPLHPSARPPTNPTSTLSPAPRTPPPSPPPFLFPANPTRFHEHA